MNPSFFQYFWQIGWIDVTDACLHMLHTFSLPPGLNDIVIFMILKKDCSKKVTDIHSISLCNVLHKIVAKKLANRLKCVVAVVVEDS